jgi:hypothetical protein
MGDELRPIGIFEGNLSRKWSLQPSFDAFFRHATFPATARRCMIRPCPENEQWCEMGRLAQSAWIICVFVVLASALLPGAASASAVAQGVALNAGAGCNNGNLDITLTTVGAQREGWRATDLAGSTISQGENLVVGLANFSGTFVGFQIVFSPAQAAGSRVASYAYVGATPPSAGDTAEFFVLYDCSTRQVLLSCYGPYGSCPQTAQQGLAALLPKVPAQGPLALLLTTALVGAAGCFALSRRTANRKR